MTAIFTDVDAPFALAVEHVTQAAFDAAGLADWLSDDEQARYDELRAHAVAKRSRQWLLGRYAAKVACRRWLEGQGMSVAEWKAIQISNDQNGMPLLTIHGINESLGLSIAHSGEEAVAAVAAYGHRIGVDIESRIPANLQELARRICSDAEYQRWFASLDQSELPERFLQLWLAKEATAKCIGQGLQWRPGAYAVTILGQRAAKVCHGTGCFEVRYLRTGKSLVASAWRE